MGVVLVSVPGAELSTLILIGLPITLIALLFTSCQVLRHPDINNTQGYPIHLRNLWMPLLLAASIIVGYSLWPNMSVISLVSLTSICFVVIYLAINHRKQGLSSLLLHIEQELPKLGGEITLFLSAAVMATGVEALLKEFDLFLAPQHFSASEASITMMTVVGCAIIGIHPVSSITLAGAILMPNVNDPNLLGITLLISWSIGVGVSPFSGVQLCIQSRYSIPALCLVKANSLYTLVMSFAGFCMIFGYEWIMSLQGKLRNLRLSPVF